MSNWDKKIQVMKGKLGEKIVANYLIKIGWIPYRPHYDDGPHPFDMLCAKKDKSKLLISDTKTKPARIFYPDTGIDIKHYKDYRRISKRHNIDVFLFFVDEVKGLIYGGYLKKISKPCMIFHQGRTLHYPIRQNGIIYFPLKRMIRISKIPDSLVLELQKLSSRKEKYNQIYNQSSHN